MSNWYNTRSKALFEAILLLKNGDDAKRFFRDLLSEPEIAEFGRRWQAARMLDKGESYLTIQRTTGLSSATVARISKWLNQGMGGYRLVLDRMKKAYHRKPFAVRSLR